MPIFRQTKLHSVRLNLLLFLTFCILGFWLSCSRKATDDTPVRFQLHDGTKTGITFTNQLQPSEAFNIVEYLYYYNGGGVAVGDINNDGLPDIYFTGNEVPNKLYLNKGNLEFEDISESAGVSGQGNWKTGVTMADVNGDGWLDIYVCQVGDYKVLKGRNELFINNQDGTFTEKAEAWGLNFRGFSTHAAFFDYDRDGDLDMYLLNHSVHATGNYGQSTLRLKRDSLGGDRLLRNEGQFFTDVSEEAGIFGSRLGYGLGLGIADFDNNGCPDIYISNDFHENDYLYYNNCDGTFRERIRESVAHTSAFSMGNDLADFNNDGQIDMITLDMKPANEVVAKSSVGAEPYNIYQLKRTFGYYDQYPRNMLQVNQGMVRGKSEVQFSETAYLSGIDATDWSWVPLFCDLDNDGWKDLFIGNGIWQRPNDLDYLKFISNSQLNTTSSNLELASEMPEGLVANFAFHNQKDGTFRPVATDWNLDWKGATTGAAYADLDQDGDLDLVLNNLNAEAQIFENPANQTNRHYLQLKLEGPGKNKFGIGARVELLTSNGLQVQEVYTSRGFQSGVPPIAHFGLGEATEIEALRIRWPDGSWQGLQTVPAIDTMIIVPYRPDGSKSILPEEPGVMAFEKLEGSSGIDYLHQENDFVDFDIEKLMPFMHSTLGPALAVADVNGDELPDVYVGGAKGQTGLLFIQQADGLFFPQNPLAFEPYRYMEETDAAFFDVDRDGDQDLYLVSGGSEEVVGLNAFHDRLYVNDGRGNFELATNALPETVAINGSCVVPFDFDEDGALDLFLGGYTIPGSYGKAPASALLLNNGKGRFIDITEKVAPQFKELGMVTDACVLQEDGRTTLVVVGEWMPLTFFELRGREFKRTETANTEGWWNTVEAIDLEKDGVSELLLGNFGKNTDLHPSIEEPVRLYVGDFDQNRFVDPVMTYFKQHQQYTYYGRDALEMQLIRLKKEDVEYSRFANSTFEENFDNVDIERAEQRKAVTFASAVARKRRSGWVLQELPQEVQKAPIFAFTTIDIDGDGDLDVLGGGNLLGVQPAIGKLDASMGFVLENDGRGNLIALSPQQTGFVLPGETRHLTAIPSASGDVLIVVARNNAEVLTFSIPKALQ